ncbi:MAG: glycine cleavage system protein H, partial [Deltaproteobacteria bacterium]|nr:glycine cleavage system protein H [Deltaproteobacteria bacterium]
VSDLYAPVSGTVTEVNDAVVDSPESINDEPYGDAWLLKIELSDAGELDGLMTAEDYKAYTEEEK